MRRLLFLALVLLAFTPRAALSQGAPLVPEFPVNTYTTGFQWYSSVAADGSGDFVVVWRSDQQDGSYPGVLGQRYSEIVPVELTGFRVE
jgi:hypothetical protein